MPVPGKNLVIGFINQKRKVYVAGFTKTAGQILWKYLSPYHQVHASHNAPMPRPGMLIGNTCHAPAHIYPTFGLYPVTFTITDKDGGTGSSSVSHVVIFNFTGFFSPVENLPAWNSATAGQAIPIKFSLGGNKGLNIFVPNSPLSVEVSCDPVAPIGADLPTVTPGSSDLTYSAGGQYIYVWKTDKAWAGTCRQLVEKLIDGTEHRVNVKFK